jgi:serine/threonine protein kinase/tetratricopeptide (TPR) repeat protein
LLFANFPDKIETHERPARKTQRLKTNKENTGSESAGSSAKADPWTSSGDTEPQVRYLNLPRLEKGSVINDRYRVEKLIGKGGFGMVFAGYDLTLKTAVALKFFDPESLQDEKKFLRVQREINLARKISDPRIVKIYSLEKWSGIWFMVMELVRGATLKDKLKAGGHFAWEEFRPVFLEILGGVESLHAQGIIHRDLKPSNIMVDADGGIKILDFGLAKEIGDLEKTSSIGEIVGSPFYLSPEQIQGLDLDEASDIYQLGILLYQSLTGAYPFADTSTMGLVLMHLNHPPDRIAARGIRVPEVVEFVAARALAKKKQDRFHSAAEMGERLRMGKVPALAAVFARAPRALRLAALLAVALSFLAAAYALTYGSRRLHAVAAEGTAVQAVNRFGRSLWRKDFAPFSVHLARITRGSTPSRSQDQQNPIKFIHASFLADLPYQPSPQVLVFLSQPGKGVFAPNVSVDSDHFDNRLAILDSRGSLVAEGTYSKTFDLRPYDFASVFTMSDFTELGSGEGGEGLFLFHLQNFQGMYPSAQVAVKGTTFAVLCSPGSIQEAHVLKNSSRQVSLLVLGADNLLSHLVYLTEMSFSPGRGHNVWILPDYFREPGSSAGDFLVFLPRRCQIVENHWLDQGRVVLFDRQERETITVHRDGRLAVDRGGRISTYQDNSTTLALAYGLVNECFQQKTVRRNLDKALELSTKAARLPVQNPFLRSALLCLKGDCETRLGRYEIGKKDLEEALRVFPRNNDAIQRLLEIAYFEKGAAAAIALFDRSYSQGQNLYGLGDSGNYLFAGFVHLAAGQEEKGREYFEKIYQGYFIDARETLLGILEIFKGNYEQARRLLTRAEGKVPGFFDIRELRLLLARSLVLARTDPERARWILEDLAKFSLRQGHMAEVSLCYLLARQGKAAEARERIGPAFAQLQKMAVGDFETRLWLWYDAFIYARTMELVGDRREARKGYRASLEANPHTALAGEARAALTKL